MSVVSNPISTTLGGYFLISLLTFLQSQNTGFMTLTYTYSLLSTMITSSLPTPPHAKRTLLSALPDSLEATVVWPSDGTKGLITFFLPLPSFHLTEPLPLN